MRRCARMRARPACGAAAARQGSGRQAAGLAQTAAWRSAASCRQRAGSRRRVQAALCPLCGAQGPDCRRTKAQRSPHSPCADRTAELRAGLLCGGQAGQPAAAGAPSPPPPRTTALHNQGLPQRACPTLGVGPRTATCRRTSPFKDLVPSFAEEWARARRLVVVQAPQASGRAPAVRGPCWAQDKAQGRHARHPARPVGGYAQRLSQGGARRRKRQYAYSCPLPSPRRPAPPAPQRNLAAAARHESALYFTGVRRPRRRRRDRAPRSCPPAGT